MEKNSKIYVAGHLGLVGSALVRNLKEKGYNHIIGKSISELDLMNQAETLRFFQNEKPDYVFLAAAKVGGIMANNIYRGQFIYENLQIQNNIIHGSYLGGVKKLLFLGSSCIYPKNAPQPLKEDYLLTSELEYTNEPYAIAKIAGIKLIESYNIQYSTNYISVMPTNLYGPNDNYDLEKSHVLPALIRKMHLAKLLKENNWDAIRKDLNKKPLENFNGSSSQNDLLQLMAKYGMTYFDAHDSSLAIELNMRKQWEVDSKKHEESLPKVSPTDYDSTQEIESLQDMIKLKNVYRIPLGERNGKKIWIVDGYVVRRDIYPDFGFSGNGQAYHFIPVDEIWIDGQITCEETEYSISLELKEAELMSKGQLYDDAYTAALLETEKRKEDNRKLAASKQPIKKVDPPYRDNGTGREKSN